MMDVIAGSSTDSSSRGYGQYFIHCGHSVTQEVGILNRQLKESPKSLKICLVKDSSANML
jgi:hypothetical protein